MNKYKFWLDTETTGLKAEIHQILEYAIIVEDYKGNRVEELEVKINLRPFVNPEKGALETNKIDPYSKEWISAAVSEEMAAEKLARLCKKYTVGNSKPKIIAYNADFDISHIRMMFRRHGILFERCFNPTAFDPMKTAKAYINKKIINTRLITTAKRSYNSAKLEDVAAALNVSTDKPAHRALNDVETLILVTREIYKLATNKSLYEAEAEPERFVYGEVHNVVLDAPTGLNSSHVKVVKNFVDKTKVLVFDLADYERIGLAPSNMKLLDYSLIVDKLPSVEADSNKLDSVFSSNMDFIQAKIKEFSSQPSVAV